MPGVTYMVEIAFISLLGSEFAALPRSICGFVDLSKDS